MRRFGYLMPAIVLAIVIFFLSTTDGQDLPKVDIVNADKLAHLLCYLVFTTSLIWGLQKSDVSRGRWAAVLITFLYGVLMEVLQDRFYPSRHFDLWDVLANGAGCILAAFLIPFLWKR